MSTPKANRTAGLCSQVSGWQEIVAKCPDPRRWSGYVAAVVPGRPSDAVDPTEAWRRVYTNQLVSWSRRPFHPGQWKRSRRD